MAVITSMFETMDTEHQNLMNQNHEHLENMLDFAIEQLEMICEDGEIMLIDDMHICTTYDQIFTCLKHWSEKRIAYKKDDI